MLRPRQIPEHLAGSVDSCNFHVYSGHANIQWLNGQVGISAAAFEEGNPLDRVISLALILLAIGVLMSRSLNWGALIAGTWRFLHFFRSLF